VTQWADLGEGWAFVLRRHRWHKGQPGSLHPVEQGVVVAEAETVERPRRGRRTPLVRLGVQERLFDPDHPAG
jgi:hypothetical protein